MREGPGFCSLSDSQSAAKGMERWSREYKEQVTRSREARNVLFLSKFRLGATRSSSQSSNCRHAMLTGRGRRFSCHVLDILRLELCSPAGPCSPKQPWLHCEASAESERSAPSRLSRYNSLHLMTHRSLDMAFLDAVACTCLCGPSFAPQLRRQRCELASPVRSALKVKVYLSAFSWQWWRNLEVRLPCAEGGGRLGSSLSCDTEEDKVVSKRTGEGALSSSRRPVVRNRYLTLSSVFELSC